MIKFQIVFLCVVVDEALIWSLLRQGAWPGPSRLPPSPPLLALSSLIGQVWDQVLWDPL